MASVGLSDRIRKRAVEEYVRPALQSGSSGVTIRVRDLMRKLEAEGFPANHPAQFCTALQKKAFLQEYDLVPDGKEGPPSGKSTTVVLHYRFLKQAIHEPANKSDESTRKADERAEQFVNRLRGLLKDELAEYGGGEAFIQWIRSEDQG